MLLYRAARRTAGVGPQPDPSGVPAAYLTGMSIDAVVLQPFALPEQFAEKAPRTILRCSTRVLPVSVTDKHDATGVSDGS